MRIASFNVRGLASTIRKRNIFNDAEFYKCDIIAIQETKINKTDEYHNNFRLISFDSTCRHYGLAFLISPKINRHLQKFWIVNDRIAVLRLQYNSNNNLSKSKYISIINVYGPTTTITNKNPKIREEFYESLKETIKSLKQDTIIVCGDFNSKIGNKTFPDFETCTGSHSRGIRNENGDALIEFCIERNFFISNSAFKHKARHITTWEGQRRDISSNTIIKIYNQIDYILVPQRLRSNLIDSRTYAGTRTSSDHRLLITTINIENPKYYHKAPSTNKTVRFHTESLHEAESAKRIQFQNACTEIRYENWSHSSSPNDKLRSLNRTLKTAAEKTLQPKEKSKNFKTHCPEIESLSKQQKQLRLDIQSAPTEAIATQKRKQRNEVLHRIRDKALENHNKEIDNIVQSMAMCSYSSATYQAVNMIRKKPAQKVVIQNESKHFVDDDREKLEIMNAYMKTKYKGPNIIQPFDNKESTPLDLPISTEEVVEAIACLNNNKAPGIDDIQAELIKAAPDVFVEDLVDIYNNMFEENVHLNIGEGKLILIPKPGKPVGPPSNLRPIVLLTATRKILSNITYFRIKEKVNSFLSHSQAGFRPLRSTADIVWAHRWMVARIEKYKEEYAILGIDMSSAFDTIDRNKLLEVCRTFLDNDDVRLIQVLLANTQLHLSFGKESTTIPTIIGTPQGDSISPVLFIIYLEAALQDVRPKILPLQQIPIKEMIYADDVDFLFKTKENAETAMPIITETLKKWNLIVNEAKTELVVVKRSTDSWRKSRKLGSLIDTSEDIKRRKTLATIAFNSMYKIWIRNKMIQKEKIIQLYNTLVLPILLYNAGTWSLTKKESETLNAFHRKQLRKIMDIHWQDKITNKTLYEITKSKPIVTHVAKRRWSLFGHILRRDENIPAQLAMQNYFNDDKTKTELYRGRRPTCLQTTLNQDISKRKPIPPYISDHTYCVRQDVAELSTTTDLMILRNMAKDRETWAALSDEIIETYSAYQ